MSLKGETTFRCLILIGTPILTGILLLFHPLPESAEMEMTELPKGLALYEMMAPIADGFLVVHLLFPFALALLGVSVIMLLNGVQSVSASISRGCAFLFVITYIMYETIIGTMTAHLVRGAAALSPARQAVIGDMIHHTYTDPLIGDLPSLLSITAWLSWILAVTLAALALHRAGRSFWPCFLLGLSFIFVSHASMLGPLGMLFFLLSIIGIERARSPILTGRYERSPLS